MYRCALSRLRSLSSTSRLVAGFATASVYFSTRGFHSTKTFLQEDDKQKKDTKKKKEEEEESFFDITKNWSFEEAGSKAKTLMGKLVPKGARESVMGEKEKEPEVQQDFEGTLRSMASDFMSFMSGGKENSVADLVSKARESTEPGDVEDTTSFVEIVGVLDKYKDMLGNVAEKYMGDIDFSQISATALYYYLEHEDERKNPSWKRRMHRFCPGINIDKVYELNDALTLAHLCYADTIDEVKEGLERHRYPYELVYTKFKSEPGKPANFIAVKQDQALWSSSLEVIMCVRGTKTVADAVTDLLCDEVDYRDGKAHGFILESGQYLAKQHKKLLENLMKKSGKSRIKLTLIGHSLGAGAASIAGIELDDHPNIDVEVVGFGCPALLSRKLAENATYITTVVNDSDMVPRLSGVALANLLLSVKEFDWIPYAKRDLSDTLNELQKSQPLIFTKTVRDKIEEILEPVIDSQMKDSIKHEFTERVEPELYPPGRCVHFWRDGSGISASYCPNHFFSEIDVSRRMIDDHVFVTGYELTFLEVMRQTKGDHHFRFDKGQVEG